MAEYIEREAFLKHMKGTSRYFTVKYDIEEFPAADVVPVVRCVNCIHYGAEAVAFDAWTPFCLKHKRTMFPNDFCSYGERKEGDG